jgi:hypothetical protein
MRTFALSAIAFGLGLTGVQLTACSNSAEDCNATATCSTAGASTAGSASTSGGGSGNDGGTPSGGSQSMSGSNGSGGQGGEPGAECNGDVADDPACWATNELGVFVSSDNGDDAAGNGSKEAPFKTIMKGVAASAGRNVYVCLGVQNDVYEEQITLSGAQDGIHLYGGFDCADWSYSQTRRALVQSEKPIGLLIEGLQIGALVENFRVVSSMSVNAGESSYGAFVRNSKNVTLRRLEITAGEGAKGDDGEPGTDGVHGSALGPAPAGMAADCSTPPANQNGASWGDTKNCTSIGGDGGQAHNSSAKGGDGGSGAPTFNVSPLGGIENGGLGATLDVEGDDGRGGMTGDSGTLGESPTAEGTFESNGYLSADGKPGTSGFPGQGGGGGGASKGNANCTGAAGGAGGLGGCGGTGGTGGKGGGASIGLYSWKSEVSLVACAIASSSGGAGGAGGAGGLAGIGAIGGAGGDPLVVDTNNIKAGGNGGRGGNGGPGGSGSGGSGGPSYALVFSGAKPTYGVVETILTPGDGGAPGNGGQQGEKAPDGSEGASLAEFQVL